MHVEEPGPIETEATLEEELENLLDAECIDNAPMQPPQKKAKCSAAAALANAGRRHMHMLVCLHMHVCIG